MSDKKLQHERLARYLDVAVPRGDRRWGNAEIEIILKAIDLERAVVEAESADTKWHFNAPAPVPVPSFNFDLTPEQLAKIAEDHRNQPLHVASAHPYAATLPLTAPPAPPPAESFSGDGNMSQSPMKDADSGEEIRAKWADTQAMVNETLAKEDILMLKARYGSNAFSFVEHMLAEVIRPRLGYGRKDLMIDIVILSELLLLVSDERNLSDSMSKERLTSTVESILDECGLARGRRRIQLEISLSRLTSSNLISSYSSMANQIYFRLHANWDIKAEDFWRRQR